MSKLVEEQDAESAINLINFAYFKKVHSHSPYSILPYSIPCRLLLSLRNVKMKLRKVVRGRDLVQLVVIVRKRLNYLVRNQERKDMIHMILLVVKVRGRD